MTEEKKSESGHTCAHKECVINWLKVVDDWSVGGYRNKFPRLYYVAIGLLVLMIII